MFSNDFIMRQIEMLARSIRYVFGLSESDELYERLVAEASDLSTLKAVLYRLTGENKFCEAENHLFEYLKEHPDEDVLMTAIHFYSMLNKKTDQELIDNNFPRDEIMDGLRAVEKIIEENAKKADSSIDLSVDLDDIFKSLN